MNDSNTDARQQIADQVVVVTGGASGIGLATCRRFALAGARVAVADINEDAIGQALLALGQIGGPGKCTGIVADVRREADMENMVRSVTEEFGRIDILVHSAGVLRGKNSSPRILPEVSTTECNEVIDTNLKGTFLCNRAVLQVMIKQKSGQIVNISSTSGLVGRAYDSVYCASKFGVVGLTESLADEVRQYGIRVFLLLPDAVDTPLWDQNRQIRAPGYALQPDRVAAVIEYMVGLPADMVLRNVIVSPFHARRRRRNIAADAGAPAGEMDTGAAR